MTLDVTIALHLKDQGSSKAARALEDMRRAAGGVAEGNAGIARSAAEIERGTSQAARGYDRVGKSAAAVVRNVGNINRAARDAASTTISSAARMTAAWGKLENMIARTARGIKGVGSGLTSVGQFGAGMAAGGYVIKQGLDKPIDFERRLADMSNTAFGDRDLAGRQAGMEELRAAVNAATKSGGGSRDSAAEALNAMISSDEVDAKTAMSMLPTLQKYGTAAGVDPTALADIAIRGVQNKFFDPSQVAEALDKAIAAGQAGGFELKDMARWLPQLMAAGIGMEGMQGYEKILSAAQASVTSSGSKDEAGNNLVNLLAKINSQDAANNFAELGIDLAGSLAAAREKGQLPLDAFVALIQREVIGKDKRYQVLQTKLAGTTDKGEQAQIMENMASILEASAVGTIIQDRQALMGLTAVMNQQGYMREVEAEMAKSAGMGQRNFDLIETTTSFKGEQLANEKAKARDGMLEMVKGPLDGLLESATGLAREFPMLTAGVTTAATAIAAMTAAATAFSAINFLRGGAGVATAQAVRAAATGGVGGAAGAVTGGASTLSRILQTGGRVVGPLAAVGLGAYEAGSALADDNLSTQEKSRAVAGAVGGTGGALAGGWGGAKIGAAIGTAILPGLGTAIGGVLGGAIGGLGGYLLGHGLAEKAQEIVVDNDNTITVQSQLMLDGAVVARTVNRYNSREMTRR